MSLFSQNNPSEGNSSKVCHVYPFTDAAASLNKPGYRNVVIRWKSRKDDTGKVIPAHTPVLVSIPVHEIVCVEGALQGMMQDCYNAQCDALVRAYIEDEMKNNYNLTGYNIPESKITSSDVLKYYNDTKTDGRGAGKLSSAMISEWFGATLENKLASAFLEKSGKTEDELSVDDITRLESAVSRYKEQFTKLAAPSVKLKGNVLDQIERALALVDGDAISVRLMGVINKARNAREDVELEELL